jgi:hypothetical protein
MKSRDPLPSPECTQISVSKPLLVANPSAILQQWNITYRPKTSVRLASEKKVPKGKNLISSTGLEKTLINFGTATTQESPTTEGVTALMTYQVTSVASESKMFSQKEFCCPVVSIHKKRRILKTEMLIFSIAKEVPENLIFI